MDKNSSLDIVSSLEDNIHTVPYDDLLNILNIVKAEQKLRHGTTEDPQLLLEHGYDVGFTKKGPKPPWISNNMLICCGVKLTKPSGGHTCQFIVVDDNWSWEHPDVLADSLKTEGDLTKAVSILPIWEDMSIKVITSAAQTGLCKAKHVKQYTVQNNQLVFVGEKKITGKTYSHR